MLPSIMCCFDHTDLCLWCGLSKSSAVKAVAVPKFLNARTCCTFWRNLLHFNSCSSSECEMEAGRNGLVEGMTGGNDCLLFTPAIMPQRRGWACSTESEHFSPAWHFTVLIADLWKSCSTPAGARYGLGAEATLEKLTVTLDKENFTKNLECMRK